MVTNINTDGKENGWFPPSDNSGKIYINARGWTSNPQNLKPTYNQAEHFLQLLDKYVSHAVDIIPERVLSRNGVLQILPQNCFTKLYIRTKS